MISFSGIANLRVDSLQIIAFDESSECNCLDYIVLSVAQVVIFAAFYDHLQDPRSDDTQDFYMHEGQMIYFLNVYGKAEIAKSWESLHIEVTYHARAAFGLLLLDVAHLVD